MRRDSVDFAFARALERDRRRDAAESAKRRAEEELMALNTIPPLFFP